MLSKKQLKGFKCATCDIGIMNMHGMPAQYHSWKNFPSNEKKDIVCFRYTQNLPITQSIELTKKQYNQGFVGGSDFNPTESKSARKMKKIINSPSRKALSPGKPHYHDDLEYKRVSDK